MGYKILHRGFHGDERLCHIAEYVEVKLGEVGGHGYGQLEQVEAELDATREVLLKLVGIVSRSMTPADIHELTGAEWDPSSRFIAKIVEDVS